MDPITTCEEFPFLAKLEGRWREFRRDFDVLRRHFKLGAQTSNTSIVGQVRGFSYFLHGRTIPEMIELGFRHPDWTDEHLPRIKKSFEDTLALPEISESMQFLQSVKAEMGLISAYFSSIKPGGKFLIHFNEDPYLYRAHLGLTIPSGDIGLKVADTVVKWKEGKVFVFDTTNPHLAWNLSDQERTILIVDFYRPERPREEMIALENACLAERLERDKTSFGFSGGSKQQQLTDDQKMRYGTEPVRIFDWAASA